MHSHVERGNEKEFFDMRSQVELGNAIKKCF